MDALILYSFLLAKEGRAMEGSRIHRTETTQARRITRNFYNRIRKRKDPVGITVTKPSLVLA
jgi:hypothetical protein